MSEPEYCHTRDGRLDEVVLEGDFAVCIERIVGSEEWRMNITLPDGRPVVGITVVVSEVHRSPARWRPGWVIRGRA
jgi:hypothetical protein